MTPCDFSLRKHRGLKSRIAMPVRPYLRTAKCSDGK